MMQTLLVNLSVIDAASIFQWVVDNADYWLVFLLMTVESSFIPFPSEVVVPPAAYLACTTGDMSIVGVTLMATLGAICGAMINYYLSMWIGRPIVYAFAESRIGRACLITPEKVKKAEDYFDSHGAVSTFIGRLIPAVRQLISIPAGLARMNVGVFALFTGLGALVWNMILAGLGWWLGKTVPLAQLFDKVEQYNDYLTYAGLGIGLIALGVILWNAFKPKTNKSIS